MTAQELQSLIESSLPNTQAIIETEDNVHFNAIVISEAFNDVLSKVKQQQMVYQAIDKYIASGELHAIAMKTYTPKRWESMQQK
ncbi:BolA family protein [Facilibium subflavum]|uniref:BolA family protein n=1 Tax=Facilibium subflavum TaxID=2219058 RepID=UPI000E646405|nr:BolA/IbaG family iron-sulfur metabolism protein [Facilibium subflavum]